MPTERHFGAHKEAKKIRIKLSPLSGSSSNPSQKSPMRIPRRLSVFFLCLSLVSLTLLVTLVAIALADPAGDIASKQSEASSVQADINNLSSQLEAKVESYDAANSKLGEIRQSIKDNQAQLDQATATLNVTQGRLDNRVEKIYRNGSVDMLDVLMDTSNLDEFLTKYDMLTRVGEQDRNDVEQVKQLKARVEDAKTKLAAGQDSQQQLVAQLDSQKSEIESGLAQRKQMLAGISGEIAQLQAQEQAQQAQALQAQVASENSSSGGGGGGGGGDYGPPPAATHGDAVSIAMSYLGVPYVWGGASRSGVDCSGLVMLVYGQLGISLPHFAAAQYAAGTPISYGDLQPGDLVFFGYGGIDHVGIYIGGGQMIHAPFEGETVQIAPVSAGGSYRGACRL